MAGDTGDTGDTHDGDDAGDTHGTHDGDDAGETVDPDDMHDFEDPDHVAASFARSFPAVYLRFHRRDEKGSQLPTASRGVLQHLALSGPVTVGELCDHLDRAQSVVSDIVAHLELKGLVERQDDPDDRRRRLVWLSPFGRDFLQHEQGILSVALLRSAIATMAPADRAALTRGMRALLAADRGTEDAAGDAVRSRPALPTHRKPKRKDRI